MSRRRRVLATVLCGAVLLVGACGGDDADGDGTLGLPETGSFVDRFPPSTIDVSAVTAPVEVDGDCVTGYRALDGLADGDGHHVVLVVSIEAEPERPDALYDLLASPACAAAVNDAEAAVRAGLGLNGTADAGSSPVVLVDLAFETSSGRVLSLPVPSS